MSQHTLTHYAPYSIGCSARDTAPYWAKRFVASLFAAICLSACDGAPTPVASVDISPRDFALQPCGNRGEGERCALIKVGGKALLFGAPASAPNGVSDDALASLDAVVLFSLRGRDIAGLDEIRNQSWAAGRARELPVVGPLGTVETVNAINTAYEISDALFVSDYGLPVGGYDAALLEPIESGPDGSNLFDTGDVVVSGASGWAIGVEDGLTVSYAGHVQLVFDACDQQYDSSQTQDPVIRFGCDANRPDLSWPLTKTVFIYRASGPE